MKKTKNAYFKLLAILIATVLTTGCVRIIHQYSPQRTSGWKKEDSRQYKYQCNGSAVSVFPLQVRPLYEDKPSMSIKIHNSKGIQECKLSFLWLEDEKTVQRVNPIRVEMRILDKTTAYCFYYFDITDDKDVRYNLRFSEHLLDCPINPIPYIFEKSWEVYPQDVM